MPKIAVRDVDILEIGADVLVVSTTRTPWLMEGFVADAINQRTGFQMEDEIRSVLGNKKLGVNQAFVTGGFDMCSYIVQSHVLVKKGGWDDLDSITEAYASAMSLVPLEKPDGSPVESIALTLFGLNKSADVAVVLNALQRGVDSFACEHPDIKIVASCYGHPEVASEDIRRSIKMAKGLSSQCLPYGEEPESKECELLSDYLRLLGERADGHFSPGTYDSFLNPDALSRACNNECGDMTFRDLMDGKTKRPRLGTIKICAMLLASSRREAERMFELSSCKKNRYPRPLFFECFDSVPMCETPAKTYVARSGWLDINCWGE